MFNVLLDFSKKIIEAQKTFGVNNSELELDYEDLE